MDALEALGQARNEFETRLKLIGPEHWENATPCPEWNVRGLVNHMMLGNRMTVQLLGGATAGDVIAGLDDNLVEDLSSVNAEFETTANDLHAGFAADGGLAGTVNHPMGEIPRTMFIHFRACDYGIHAWDLARGLGIDDQLDTDLVQWLWNECQPMKDGLAETGMFGTGASGSLGDDAPLQDRYLDTFGRRP